MFSGPREAPPADEAARQGAPGISILTLNAHLPVFPGGGGVEALTTRHLAGLAECVGLVSIAHSAADVEKLRPLAEAGVRLFVWSGQGGGVRAGVAPAALSAWAAAGLRSLAGALRSAGSRPSDARLADSAFRRMAPGLWQALCERPWPVLSIVESGAAGLLGRVPRPRIAVLVMHDVRALLYERAAASASSPWTRSRLRREARRLRAFEERWCRAYDLVVTVSRQDEEWVRSRYGARRVVTVPLPVDADYFRPAPPEAEEPGCIVLTGLMSHPPNADAACYFARDVLPAVRAERPEARFVVVGRQPTTGVRALGRLPGVEVTGEVEDVRPYLARASVVVAPLRFGSGARQKILEAWCMEKCVVATPIGAEGLEPRHGENLLLAEDAPGLARQVSRALGDPAWRDRVRGAGREIALRSHDPRRVAAGYHAALGQALRDSAPAGDPARILVDLRWMVPGLAGGLETVGRALLAHLAALQTRDRYTVILPSAVRHELDLRDSGHLRLVARDGLGSLLAVTGLGFARAVQGRVGLVHPPTDEMLRLARLRDYEAEVAYSLPGYVHPELYPLRQVLLVPDVQHEYLPEFFTPEALEERRRLYGEALRRADRILAISDFTRRSLIERLGVPPHRVATAPLAPARVFHDLPQGEAERRLRRLGLARATYLFFPAHTWHHKNHRAALTALRLLRDRHGLRPLLICSGAAREAQPALDAQVRTSGLEGQVRFLGHRAPRDVAALYRGAAALVFPSLFEGFGLPVLEAMASACPVVCSSATSLPEVAGDAALLVDPQDPEALADALARVLREPDLAARLRAEGRARAARFTWEAHTRRVLGAIHAVVEEARGRPGSRPVAQDEPCPSTGADAELHVGAGGAGWLYRGARAWGERRWLAGAVLLLAGGLRSPMAFADGLLAPVLHRKLAAWLDRYRRRRGAVERRQSAPGGR